MSLNLPDIGNVSAPKAPGVPPSARAPSPPKAGAPVRAPRRKTPTDVVGLEIGRTSTKGIPAVRLRRKEGRIELLAAGFLSLPGTFPETERDAETPPPHWILPKAFQAPNAAIAVASRLSFLRHTGDPIQAQPETKQHEFRHVSKPVASDMPPLLAALPEFQAAWAARVFPEGYRPTACSIQLSGAAALSSFLAVSGAAGTKDGSIVFLTFPTQTALAAFHGPELVFYREYPVGYAELRGTIMKSMNLNAEMADSVMQDVLVDPVPVIQPLLTPLFRQAEIASDYLARRCECETKHFCLYGLPVGARYWSELFDSMMGHRLETVSPVKDIAWPAKAPDRPASFDADLPLYIPAIGAARAVLEDEP